jgi:uncharacterized protein
MTRTSLQFARRLCLVILSLTAMSAPAFSQAKVVISQIYGGGGNGGSTYKNDFVELFNAGDTAQSLTGWSVQYGSATGSSWNATALSGTIQPGHYYLVQESAGTGGSVSLPTPDATGTLALSATAGKVALVSSATALTGACPTAGVIDFIGFGTTANCSEGTAAPAPSNTTAVLRAGAGCTDGNVNSTDFASGTPNPHNSASATNACIAIQSFGTVTTLSQSEGNSGTTPFVFTVKLNIPAPSAVTFNASTVDGTATAPSDYTALASTAFTIPAAQQSVTVTVLVNGDTLVEPDETFSVTLSNISGASPLATTLTATGTIVNDDASAANLSFSPSTLPGGPEGTAYSQVLTVVNGDTCTFGTSGSVPPGLTLTSSGTSNTATLAGTPAFSGSFAFTVSASCAAGSTSQNYTVAVTFACESGAKTSTAIHTIQGSGTTSPLVGQTVEVEGIVVGSFQLSTQLKGFYLQEPDATWDADPLTSEGIFIYDNLAGASVNIGDRVRVRGTVDEYASSGSFLGDTLSSSLTEIGSLANKTVCSTGNTFTRTTVSLPIATAGDLERNEGMAVQFTQQLTVTGNYSLGTYDQLDLAPSMLYTPTSSANQATWPAQTSLIARSVIALDDASTLTNANLYPTVYPQGGLSATNTLRVGALVNYDAATQTNTPLIGVLDDRFGEFRLQPSAAVTFYAANPRPAIAPILAATASRFRAVSANVLNFFTTLGSRGAATSAEFDKQKTKIVEALSAMNADVYGLTEMQNYANGNASGDTYTNVALQSLVDGLNCKKSGLSPLCTTPTVTPYTFIDTLGLGSSNGTDAIRSAIVYNPSVLTPVGSAAAYYQNDTNRPALAQTFQPATGVKADRQTFTFAVNHLRSKGSACGGTSDDVYQGSCNGLRLNMIQNVVTWLAGNPTADPATTRRQLLVGDFNAYYGEDPMQYLANHGYTNLIAGIIGSAAYSYNYGSQAGYLDHALANSAMNGLVRSVAEWHNNADEPSSLQALKSSTKSAAAQAAYYGADAYAASDHDPIVIGFNTLAGDLNDDGTIDAKDQALLTAALNKSASAVDRRMDFDGDGKITLNDYRLWTALYRAFLQ